MIWTENFKQTPGGRYVQDVTFDGRMATASFTSGTVNLLDIMKWVIAKGWLSDRLKS